MLSVRISNNGRRRFTENEFQFSWLINNDISGSILITKSMSSNTDWLRPSWRKESRWFMFLYMLLQVQKMPNHTIQKSSRWQTWNNSRDVSANDRFPENCACKSNYMFLEFGKLKTELCSCLRGINWPFKMFLIVPLGLLHIFFKLNSLTRSSSVGEFQKNLKISTLLN